MASYPYFQNAAIGNAEKVFFDSLQATRDAVNRVSPGKWVWITETGGPVSGPNSGAAVS
jgi:exo-beta-1,3-glucanase (GH17 family)